MSQSKNYSNVSLPAKMEKIYGMHKLLELQLFLSGTPTFSSGTPTFCQMGVLNSCFQNPSQSSVTYDVHIWPLNRTEFYSNSGRLYSLRGYNLPLSEKVCLIF